MTEQIVIFFQIVFIDLVLAGDNAIIIGMVASQFPTDKRKKIIFWGIGAAIILRIIFTLLLPIAFLTTVPSRVILGDYNIVLISHAFILATLFFSLSRLFWKFALKHYTSASS